MNENKLLNVTDEIMTKNMVTLIEDEDTELSGASTPVISALTAISTLSAGVSALFGSTSACTTRCWHP